MDNKWLKLVTNIRNYIYKYKKAYIVAVSLLIVCIASILTHNLEPWVAPVFVISLAVEAGLVIVLILCCSKEWKKVLLKALGFSLFWMCSTLVTCNGMEQNRVLTSLIFVFLACLTPEVINCFTEKNKEILAEKLEEETH